MYLGFNTVSMSSFAFVVTSIFSASGRGDEDGLRGYIAHRLISFGILFLLFLVLQRQPYLHSFITACRGNVLSTPRPRNSIYPAKMTGVAHSIFSGSSIPKLYRPIKTCRRSARSIR